MKKNLILVTAFVVVSVFAASVFSEQPKPADSANRPQRPSVRTPRPGPRGGMQRPSRAPQRRGGLEAIKQQQAKRVESEIKRVKAAHEAELTRLKAILKQANEEKAVKTAAMITQLIEKKNQDNEAMVKKIKDRAEAFNKRIQKARQSKDQPGRKVNQTKPARAGIPISPASVKPSKK